MIKHTIAWMLMLLVLISAGIVAQPWAYRLSSVTEPLENTTVFVRSSQSGENSSRTCLPTMPEVRVSVSVMAPSVPEKRKVNTQIPPLPLEPERSILHSAKRTKNVVANLLGYDAEPNMLDEWKDRGIIKGAIYKLHKYKLPEKPGLAKAPRERRVEFYDIWSNIYYKGKHIPDKELYFTTKFQ